MNWDDLKPKPAKTAALGESLETLSVAELEQRVAALQAEIARVESEVARKKQQASAADALFKKV
jgi:uncharacterized small protein (DUF1192 family)